MGQRIARVVVERRRRCHRPLTLTLALTLALTLTRTLTLPLTLTLTLTQTLILFRCHGPVEGLPYHSRLDARP